MPKKVGLTNFSAIIFDMDGLILDTEAIALSTFVQTCREHNFEPDLSVFYKCIGVDGAATRQIMSEGYGKAFPLESVAELWGKKMDLETTEKPIPLKTGVLSLLKYLDKEQTKMALVTSTRRAKAQRELTNAGVAHFFSLILGGDQVTKGKPDPEIYMTACEKLHEEPAKCLALEDSDNGVKAAFHAGLRVIQVPDLVPPSDEVRALGHIIKGSLAEVENMLKTSRRVDF